MLARRTTRSMSIETTWNATPNAWRRRGFNAVRMGEFAWHIFEPQENRFDFALFDRAIAVLGRHGIKSIMCTPTATPPRWLTMRHPEILRVDEYGRTASHGSRQHADTCSPVFREHSRRITRAMAPNTTGATRTSSDGRPTTNSTPARRRPYSEAALAEFQQYLAERYGTVDALNRAWGGDFWATAYDDFGQVVPARRRRPRLSRTRPCAGLSSLHGLRHGTLPTRSG